jgi:hypothetical protein
MGCSGYLELLRKRRNWKDKPIPHVLVLPAIFLVLLFLLGWILFVKGDKKR